MNDPVVEKSELMLDALKYAHKNSLDINKIEDVEKILEAVDPEHKENFDEFMELLKNADAAMDMTAKESVDDKTDLSN